MVNGVVDCDRSKKEQRTLPFDWQWVNHFIGIEVGPEEQKAIWSASGFQGGKRHNLCASLPQ